MLPHYHPLLVRHGYYTAVVDDTEVVFAKSSSVS